MIGRLVASWLVANACWWGCSFAAAAEPGAATSDGTVSTADAEFFEKSVRPLLAEHCYSCHGPDKQRANLRVDSRAGLLTGGDSGPALIAGKADESLLIAAINYGDDYKMPPKGKLSATQIATLTEWVQRGALWPGGDQPVGKTKVVKEFHLAERAQRWSFQPLSESVLKMTAAAKTTDAPASSPSPIDSLLQAQRTSGGVSTARPAERNVWLRRVTFDLTGLPPTPAELAAFLADERADAFERVVDRLLASPRYGERWARHWLDLVRYAETYGHEFDFEIPHAWRYRDYVIRAFNADVPYDQFLREQLAGDLIQNPRRHPDTGANESVIGTGFYWFGEQTHSPVDALQAEADRIDNQLDVLSKTFLGMTVACARCHDHKFDPIRQADYYALFGILQSSRFAHVDVLPAERNLARLAELRDRKRTLRTVTAEALRPAFERLDQDLLAVAAATTTTSAATADQPTAEPESPESWTAQIARAKEPTHPLFAWQELTKAGKAWNARAATDLWHGLNKSARRPPLDPALRLVDFSLPLPPDWFITGDAFAEPAQRPGDFIVGNRSARPVAAVVARPTQHSGALSPRLQGTLQTPDFTLSQPFVHVRVAGWQARVRLVIDGFQLIRSPIYGGLTKVVASDEPRWLTFDAKMWAGHRAYLEFSDLAPQDPADPNPVQASRTEYGKEIPPDGPEENIYGGMGWLAVDEILLSSEGPPPAAAWGGQTLLAEPAPTTLAELAARYRLAALSALDRWRAGDALNTDQAALLDCLLGHSPAGVVPESATAAHTSWDGYAEATRQLERPVYALAMQPGTPHDTPLYIRGSPKNRGPVVARRFLEVFAPAATAEVMPTDRASATAGEMNRLSLAESMLTLARAQVARVYANRLWLHLFGTGLVPTVDDFGHMGQDPAQLELLDYLAAQLQREGWSTKKLLRRLALSNAYRMTSQPDPAAMTIDPENKLWHHLPVRRIEAEAIRDSMLAVSGRLDSTMFGPPIAPHLSAFMSGRGRPGKSGPVDGAGRRSLYLGVRRNFLNPMFLAFDFPLPFSTVGRRTMSHVPSQALALMNNPAVLDEARRWARGVLDDPTLTTDEARLQSMYLTAFARLPTTDELHPLREFLAGSSATAAVDQQQRWTDLAHVLFNSSEFIFLR